MENSTSNRQWASLDVPLPDFQHRIRQIQDDAGRLATGSVLSRLALIHQAAKSYALAALQPLDIHASDISIEEITDPPMFDVDIPEGVVIIQYSYINAANADKFS